MPTQFVALQASPRLPAYESAQIPEGKLRNYALNPVHPKGRHKAHVFKSMLGIEEGDAGYLREQVLDGLATAEAVLCNPETGWGQEWEVYIPIEGHNGCMHYVTTKWIIGSLDDPQPRLATLYVEKSTRKLREIDLRRERWEEGSATRPDNPEAGGASRHLLPDDAD